MAQGETEGLPIDVGPVLQACARKDMLVTVPGYADFMVKGSTDPATPPSMLRKSAKLAKMLGVSDEVNKWEWASQKKGTQLTDKLVKFADNMHQPNKLLPMDLLLMLTELIYSEPHVNGKPIKEVPLDLDDLPNQLEIRDSSSGLDPTGNPRGTNKRDHAAFAVGRFVQQTFAGPFHTPPYVYEVQSKGNEFLPKIKAQRKIFCESSCQLVTFQTCFSGLVYRKRNFFNGTAQNLSMGGNTGFQYVMKLTPDLDWNDCKKIRNNLVEAKELLAGKHALNESDKSSWEYRISPFLRVIPMMSYIYLTEWKGKETYLMPLVPAIAGYIDPLVALQGKTAIRAPLLNTSGSYWTLRVNTDGHTLMVIHYKQSAQRNKIKLEYVNPPKVENKVYKEKALKLWKKSATTHGDDFISRNVFTNYDSFVDTFWKTVTKTSVGSAHSTRFLQRHLKWVGLVPQLVYDSHRARIKMCAPRKDDATLAESIKSILLSTGDLDLADEVRDFVLALKVKPLTLIDDKRAASTASAFLNRGVLQRFWLPNSQLARDTGTMYALGERFAAHPDYLETIRKK
jgi:hypothetical protein